MKVKYAIEKEIEVRDEMTDKEIDTLILSLCNNEDGSDYIWVKNEGKKESVLRYNF